MTDAESVFFLLSMLYLVECAFWVRPGAFVFSTQFGAWFRRVNLHWALLRNHDGGILLANIFPWGQASVSEQWPISISPEGIYAYVSQAPSSDGRPQGTERFVTFDQLRKVEYQGQRLYLNGVLFVRVATVGFARELSQLIQRLKTLSAVERGPVIQAALDHHVDATAAREQLRKFRRATADLRLTCSLLFFLVIAYPLFVIVLDPFAVFSPLLFAYAGLVLLAVPQFWQAHAYLYPKERMERFKQALVLLISPADAIHSRDKLSRPLLGMYHPLVVARIVCQEEDFQEYAHEVWRDLEFPVLPVCPEAESKPHAVEAWFRQRLRETLERFMVAEKVNLGVAGMPPKAWDATCVSYCPRCLGQYVIEEATCAGCGEQPLVKLPR